MNPIGQLREELQGDGVQHKMMQYQAPPPQAQPQQSEDPVKLLQVRLAKGEITPEQYQASLKTLQGG
jgi:uncharacterized membrane protein